MWTNLFEGCVGVSSGVQPFRYRLVGGLEDDIRDSMAKAQKPAGEKQSPPQLREDNTAAMRPVIDAEIEFREKRAREEGFKQGQASMRAELDRQILSSRESLALALKQFAGEREEYYHGVESHVVKLALAIARKILHRQSQIDPLLLAGVVRVALEKVSSATMVRMHVHPDQVQTWKEFVDRQTNLSRKPEILGDAEVVLGQCRIESSIGTAHLSVENQITEIERGFFDLLAQRPEIP